MTKPTESTAPTAPASAPKEEAIYSSYTSSRQAVKTITPAGKKIQFIDFKYITDDEDCIAYLDQCIKDKVPGITKGSNVASYSLDPMAGLRRKFFKEFKEAEAAEQELRDFTAKDAPKTAASKVSPAASDVLDKLKASATAASK